MYEVFVGSDEEGTQTVATYSDEDTALDVAKKINERIALGEDIGYHTDMKDPAFAKYCIGPDKSMNIPKLWSNFEQKVISSDATLTQRAEMRLAFIAGITVMFYALEKNISCNRFTDLIKDEVTTHSRRYCELPSKEVYLSEKDKDKYRG
jgi:hypothetical protein